MTNKILYIGGIAVIAGITYIYLTRNKGTTPVQYDYQIYNEGAITKALNLKTNQIDFTGTPKSVIESATAIGKTLIKDGIYETYNINLPSNTYLVGESNNTILKCPNNIQENVIYSFNKDNLTVRNFAINGNRFNIVRNIGHTDKQCGIYFSGCRTIDIENIYVYDTVESGIQITGREGIISSDVKIYNNTVDNTFGEGILAFNGVRNIDIKNNTSSRNGELNPNHDPACTWGCGYSGIVVMRNIQNANIQYNTVFANTIDGIVSDGDPEPQNKNVNITIKNNTSYNNIKSGIAFHDTINSNILNNSSYDNQLAGIWIADNSDSNIINDNECHNNNPFGISEFFDCKFNAFNRNNTYNNTTNQMLEGNNHNIDDKCAQFAHINKQYYTVENNTWGLGNTNLETECIYIDNNNHVGWNWNRPNGIDHITYPNVNVGVDRGIPSWTIFPKKVSEITNYSVKMTYSYPQLPTGTYNLAPEFYLNIGPTWVSFPRKAEIMFYLDHSSTDPANTVGLGTYLGNVNDGNLPYKLYYRTWTDGWRLYTFVRNGIGNTTQGPHTYTIDIKYMLDYMVTHDLLNTGTKMIDTNSYALGFEWGNEIYNGSGKIELTQLIININGQQIII